LPNGRTSVRNGSFTAATIAEPVELLLLLGVKAVVKRDQLRILRLPLVTPPARRKSRRRVGAGMRFVIPLLLRQTA
jgi:hypothetical protein